MYGIEAFFIPEARRNEMDRKLRDTRGQEQKRAVANVKVDKYGNAALVSLVIDGQEYKF